MHFYLPSILQPCTSKSDMCPCYTHSEGLHNPHHEAQPPLSCLFTFHILRSLSLEGLMLPDWSWSFKSLATWCEEQTQKRLWCWDRLKAKGEGGGRGWDGQIASPVQWAWIWANARRRWRTEDPGMLQSMGSQRVSYALTVEQQNNKLGFYWVGQNVLSGFSIRCYRKTWMGVLANPIFLPN